jgi:hypothetical protein
MVLHTSERTQLICDTSPQSLSGHIALGVYNLWFALLPQGLAELDGAGELFSQTMDFLGLPSDPVVRQEHFAPGSLGVPAPSRPSFVDEIELLLASNPPPSIDTIVQTKKAAAKARKVKKSATKKAKAKAASFKRGSKRCRKEASDKGSGDALPIELTQKLVALDIPDDAYPKYNIGG